MKKFSLLIFLGTTIHLYASIKFTPEDTKTLCTKVIAGETASENLSLQSYYCDGVSSANSFGYSCFIFKKRADGVNIIDLQKTWEKLIDEAHLMVAVDALSSTEIKVRKLRVRDLGITEKPKAYQKFPQLIVSKNTKKTVGKKYAAHNFR